MRAVGSQGEMRDLARALLAHVADQRALGVTGVPSAARADATPRRNAVPPSADAIAGPCGAATTLDGLRVDIGDCRRCKLAPGRTNLVFGVGNPNARLVFVG